MYKQESDVKKPKGYVVDNLGLPVWLYKKLLQDYPNKSIHYAIQQTLKKSINRQV